ncbi:hypothetical protein [Kineosporia mesophila]|uniref:hypothetical protein n=1 Tax=Kineosporia mesophila TaxID=566012 RepID=UPI001E2F349D|nr:hypothetical protein [Kineosporia mesophila]MCD5354183.1 hypothetical protein [Kineosporia mesophila]
MATRTAVPLRAVCPSTPVTSWRCIPDRQPRERAAEHGISRDLGGRTDQDRNEHGPGERDQHRGPSPPHCCQPTGQQRPGHRPHTR